MESNWRAWRAKLGLSACSANCVFQQRNLFYLVHHQVGSSRFSTSSSSGYIQQLFWEVDYSSIKRVSPSHRVTVIRDKVICFPTYKVQNFCMLLPFISEHLHYPSPGRRTVQLEYQASYHQCSLFWRRYSAWANWFEEAFTFWASVPLFIPHAASITIRGVLLP